MYLARYLLSEKWGWCGPTLHCLLQGPGYEGKIFWMYVSYNIWFHSASIRATLGFKNRPSSIFTSVYHLMCVWGCYSEIKRKYLTRHTPKGQKKKPLLSFSLWRWRLTTAVARVDVFAVSRVLRCAKRTVVIWLWKIIIAKSLSMWKSDSVTYELCTFTLNYVRARTSLNFHTWETEAGTWNHVRFDFHMHERHTWEQNAPKKQNISYRG